MKLNWRGGYLIILVFFVCCEQTPKESNSIQEEVQESNIPSALDGVTFEMNNEVETNPTTQNRIQRKDTLVDDFKIETEIYGIKLLDHKSVEKIKKPIELIEPRTDFPHFNLVNESGNEVFKLIFHYGGYRHSFSEFELYRKTEDVQGVVVQGEFISGNGIRLGMSMREVKLKLGTPNSKIDNGIRYRLDADLNDSKFLQEYNYPSYYINAIFENDKLIRYRFGFDYP